MEAVVEQIQQTYDLQVSGYYNQLQLVEEFLLHERELSLETDVNKSFFEAWEKESESTLIFLSLIHISEPTRPYRKSRMPSSA